MANDDRDQGEDLAYREAVALEFQVALKEVEASRPCRDCPLERKKPVFRHRIIACRDCGKKLFLPVDEVPLCRTCEAVARR